MILYYSRSNCGVWSYMFNTLDRNFAIIMEIALDRMLLTFGR